MKTPKILPWLAKKHGVAEARAAELWAEALRHATDTTGWVGTPAYWGAAMERLNELLEAEQAQSCRPPLVALVRMQNRLGMLPLIAWQGMALLASTAWQRAAVRPRPVVL